MKKIWEHGFQTSNEFGWNHPKVKIQKLSVKIKKQLRVMFSSKCAVYNSEISKFIKEQQHRGLLSNLIGIKVPILKDLPLINTLP